MDAIEGAAEEAYADLEDVRICYQTFGDPGAEPLLLVMGLSGPMSWWDPELCRRLAGQGFHVIRYDNRDTGRSTKVRGRVQRADLVNAFLGRPVDAPYTLDDLAADAFGLLDHLGFEQAHVAGMSMGGMIGQTMAVTRPGRVRSLTSVMSSTGSRRVGWQSPRVLPALIAPRGRDRETYVAMSAAFWDLIGSPGYPTSVESRQQRAMDAWDRGFSASGVMRQMLAILTQPDRSERLRELPMPVTVMHGTSDRMVHISGGRATARAIPQAELLLVEGMGHDLPPALFDTFTRAVRRTADRSGYQAEAMTGA